MRFQLRLKKKMKSESPIATCLKRDNSFTPKNAAINTKNVVVDIFYSCMFKMSLVFNTLSRVFFKSGYSSFVATFLKTWLKKPQPKTRVFCSACYNDILRKMKREARL